MIRRSGMPKTLKILLLGLTVAGASGLSRLMYATDPNALPPRVETPEDKKAIAEEIYRTNPGLKETIQRGIAAQEYDPATKEFEARTAAWEKQFGPQFRAEMDQKFAALPSEDKDNPYVKQYIINQLADKYGAPWLKQ